MSLLWEMEKILGSGSVCFCCFFLSFSLSLLIRKDKKSYPFITYTLSQGWDAGELGEWHWVVLWSPSEDDECEVLHRAQPYNFVLSWMLLVSMHYNNSGFGIFTMCSSLISLKCWAWVREVGMDRTVNFSPSCSYPPERGNNWDVQTLWMVGCMSCQCNGHSHITYQILS